MEALFVNLLEILPYSAGVETRQISGKNPTGEKKEACRWEAGKSILSLLTIYRGKYRNGTTGLRGLCQ